jgi:hypothetical protein
LNLYQLPLPTPPMNLFTSSFLAKSLGNFTSSRFKLASIAHVYGVLVSTGEVVSVAKFTFPVSFDVHIRVHFTIDVSV